MSKVLSLLISINVQAKPDINLGGQGMVITIKGWLSNRVFMQAKHMQFCKNRPIGCVYKTRTKHASKDGIELAVLKAFREVLIGTVLRIRGRGTGPRSLARSTARRRILPRSHRDLRRTQASTQSRKK